MSYNSNINNDVFPLNKPPISYSQAVQQVPSNAPVLPVITLVQDPTPTEIANRTIGNVRAIDLEGTAINFELIDPASLVLDTDNPDEVYYKCVSVNGETTHALISDCLYFTDHAIDRMEERQISYDEICYSLNANPIESYDNKLR